MSSFRKYLKKLSKFHKKFENIKNLSQNFGCHVVNQDGECDNVFLSTIIDIQITSRVVQNRITLIHNPHSQLTIIDSYVNVCLIPVLCLLMKSVELIVISCYTDL